MTAPLHDRIKAALGPPPAGCIWLPGEALDACTALLAEVWLPGEALDACTALLAECADELERLERWKAEATVVLDGWDSVWEALGRPGRPGASKAESSRREVLRLRDRLDPGDVDVAALVADLHNEIGDPACLTAADLLERAYLGGDRG